MKIILNNTYYIIDEPIGYSLNKTYVTYGKGKNKTDAPRLADRVVGYYMKVEDCAERFVEEIAHDQTDFEGNMEDYIARLNNVMESAKTAMIKKVN